MQALTSLKQRIGPLPGSTLQARNARRQASWAEFKRGAQGTMKRHSEAAAFKRGNGNPMPRRGNPAWNPRSPFPRTAEEGDYFGVLRETNLLSSSPALCRRSRLGEYCPPDRHGRDEP